MRPKLLTVEAKSGEAVLRSEVRCNSSHVLHAVGDVNELRVGPTHKVALLLGPALQLSKLRKVNSLPGELSSKVIDLPPFCLDSFKI